jgi:spermidine/putrescine transport system permease protein
MNIYTKLFSKERSFFWSAPAILWQVLFLMVPLCLIVYSAFIPHHKLQAGHTVWELVRSFFTQPYLKVIARSVFLSSATALLCLLCAYPLAYVASFKMKRIKNIFLFLLILPFWTSLLVLAYSWFFILERHGLINSILLKIGIISEPLVLLNTPGAIYITMVYCYLPFMVIPLYSALEKIDYRLVEASLDLGASWRTTFLKLILPLSMPGIRTGILLVLIPAFGEFVIPSLMGGNKQLYVGSLIAHYFVTARDFRSGSLFTVIAAVCLIALTMVWYFIIPFLVNRGLLQKGRDT